jgi:hypothetical protein
VAADETLAMTSLISPNLLNEYRIMLRSSVEPVSWKYRCALVVVAATSAALARKKPKTTLRPNPRFARANSPIQRSA